MTEETKRCPYCQEKILATAIKCKHCESVLIKTTKIICPSCSTEMGESDGICPSCGINIAEILKKCPDCGEYYFIGQPYCAKCASPLYTSEVIEAKNLYDSGKLWKSYQKLDQVGHLQDLKEKFPAELKWIDELVSSIVFNPDQKLYRGGDRREVLEQMAARALRFKSFLKQKLKYSATSNILKAVNLMVFYKLFIHQLGIGLIKNSTKITNARADLLAAIKLVNTTVYNRLKDTSIHAANYRKSILLGIIILISNCIGAVLLAMSQDVDLNNTATLNIYLVISSLGIIGIFSNWIIKGRKVTVNLKKEVLKMFKKLADKKPDHKEV